MVREIFENIINKGEFELKDILGKINESYIKNRLTKEDVEELEDLARQNANHHKSYSKTIEERVEELEKKVLALENANKTDEPFEDEEEVVDEYPTYKQPEGAHDTYMKNAKITENGKKYICLVDYCVYPPSACPQFWEEVVE